MTGRRALGAAVAVCFLIGAPHLYAQKTDLVVLTNGDRITGEIKGLSRGKLDYSTDDAGSLSIEWNKVERLTSRNNFELELQSGRKLFGTLVEAAEPGRLAVSGAAVNTVAIDSVVRIARLRASFLNRLSGYLDLGFSFAKANENVTLTSSGEVDYRGTHSKQTIAFSTYVQSNNSTTTATRNSLAMNSQWFLAPLWSLGGVATFQENSELDLDLRASLGAIGIRTLAQNNHLELESGAGLILGREKYAGSTSPFWSLEAAVEVAFDAFRYDTPKLDLTVGLAVLPSLTDLGRVRLEFDGKIKHEVFKDFFLGLGATEAFDSRPPDPNAPTNDFSISLSVGWSFRQ
jgi:Protein of unknown function, DUF481